MLQSFSFNERISSRGVSCYCKKARYAEDVALRLKQFLCCNKKIIKRRHFSPRLEMKDLSIERIQYLVEFDLEVFKTLSVEMKSVSFLLSRCIPYLVMMSSQNVISFSLISHLLEVSFSPNVSVQTKMAF